MSKNNFPVLPSNSVFLPKYCNELLFLTEIDSKAGKNQEYAIFQYKKPKLKPVFPKERFFKHQFSALEINIINKSKLVIEAKQ